MYSFKSRVRYSEVDSFGRLSTFAAINYLQDCSTFQSEDIGLGIKNLRKEEGHGGFHHGTLNLTVLCFLVKI